MLHLCCGNDINEADEVVVCPKYGWVMVKVQKEGAVRSLAREHVFRCFFP